MSLDSIKDEMTRRASDLATQAQKSNDPKEIQRIQQLLVQGVQSGRLQSYVGIPLIKELTDSLAKAQAVATQGAMGTPPAPAGPPLAQQVMSQAQRAGGVDQLPSNLPTQGYAHGGIVAFAEGGNTDGHGVQHFEEGGTPLERWWGGVKQSFGEDQQKAALLTQLKNQYGPASAPVGMFMQQSDAERQAAKSIMDVLNSRGAQLTMGQLQDLKDQGITALPSIPTPGTPAAPPAVTPPTPVAAPVSGDKTKANSLRSAVNPTEPKPVSAVSLLQNSMGNMPTGGGAVGGGGISNLKLPQMQDIAAPKLVDYSQFYNDLPNKAKKASENAVKSAQEEMDAADKPGFDAREARQKTREASNDKDRLISLYSGIIKGGAKTLAGKSPFAAENIGAGMETTVDAVTQGEAAYRNARDRLEDARDNLDAQKAAAKKGNMQYAAQRGDQAANQFTQAQQFAMTGAHYGNSDAMQLHNSLQTGAYQRASLEQSGVLGLAGLKNQAAGLGLQAQGLALQGKQLFLHAQQMDNTLAFQNKQLGMMAERYKAMDKASQARMQMAQATALANFDKNEGQAIKAMLAQKYNNPNWMVGNDQNSLTAQKEYAAHRNSYLLDAQMGAEKDDSVRDARSLINAE